MRVLLIEPDAEMADAVSLMLKASDFNVHVAEDAEEGLDCAKLYDYDVIVSAVAKVIRPIRIARVATPVILLSAALGVDACVHALSQGADDFIPKPFHKDELVARIHAVVRRSKGHAESRIVVGDMTVDIDQKSVDINGFHLHLTGKEYQIIEAMALRKGCILTKSMFLNHLYDGMDEPEEKIIDVFICRLRKKLASASGGQNYIETIWGRGWALREPNLCPPPQLYKPAGATRALIHEGKVAAQAIEEMRVA